jgi:hypothetical protein
MGESNLVPTNKRSKDEAREIGKKGGIMSGKSRRQKKLMTQIYGEFLAGKYDVTIDGEVKKISGDKLTLEIIKKILTKSRSDSAKVSLLKEIREATEGSTLNINSPLLFSELTQEEREALLAEEIERRTVER